MNFSKHKCYSTATLSPNAQWLGFSLALTGEIIISKGLNSREINLNVGEIVSGSYFAKATFENGAIKYLKFVKL